MIPNPAALQIFTEVWCEYSALIESSHPASGASDFIMDVQLALRTLYPQLSVYNRIHEQLLDSPNSTLPATRSALGDAFLHLSLWPVKNYFARPPK